MAKVISEFERVLAPGGIVYVHTKAGSGVLRTNETTVSGEEREFELATKDELHTMLVEHGFSKLGLNEVGSKSRPGLKWINAFYKKSD